MPEKAFTLDVCQRIHDVLDRIALRYDVDALRVGFESDERSAGKMFESTGHKGSAGWWASPLDIARTKDRSREKRILVSLRYGTKNSCRERQH